MFKIGLRMFTFNNLQVQWLLTVAFLFLKCIYYFMYFCMHCGVMYVCPCGCMYTCRYVEACTWKSEVFFFFLRQVSGLTGFHQWLLQTKQVSLKSSPVSTFPALELLLYIVLLLTKVLGTQLMSTHLYTTRAGQTGSAPQAAPMIF